VFLPSSRLDDLTNQSVIDRERLERQNQQLSEYEAEINLLRRRVESLENDREKDKKEIARLQEALNRARIVSDVTLSLVSRRWHRHLMLSYSSKPVVRHRISN